MVSDRVGQLNSKLATDVLHEVSINQVVETLQKYCHQAEASEETRYRRRSPVDVGTIATPREPNSFVSTIELVATEQD